jgi:ubiquitin-activating enzyme E1
MLTPLPPPLSLALCNTLFSLYSLSILSLFSLYSLSFYSLFILSLHSLPVPVQVNFYEKVAESYASGASKSSDDEQVKAALRDRAFEECKKAAVAGNYVTAGKFAQNLAQLFPERPESLQRVLKFFVDSSGGGGGGAGSSSAGGKSGGGGGDDDELSAAQMDRFSRQIGAFGLQMMNKLVKMDVLIVGLQGVGVEAAKNIVLSGPHSVSLFDPNPIAVADLGSNFFAEQSDIGKARDVVCCDELRLMNDGVKIRTVYAGDDGAMAAAAPLSDERRAALLRGPNGAKRVELAKFPLAGTGELTEDIVKAHGVVLFTGSYCRDSAALAKWSKFTHDNNIGFVACNTFGAMGFCFTDFGDKWETFDEDGEPALTRAVTNVFNGESIDATIAEESAFVQQFEKEIASIGELDGDAPDKELLKRRNQLVDRLQEQTIQVKRLHQIKEMLKPDETVIVLDREQADLRVDENNENTAFFTLEGVKGMTHKQNAEVNVNNVGLWKIGKPVRFPKKARTVKLHNPFTKTSVEIEKDKNRTTLDPHLVLTSDTRAFTAYAGGGTLVQKKVPVRKQFLPFGAAVKSPNVYTVDYSKWGSAQKMHVATQAMMNWSSSHGARLPTLDQLGEVQGEAAKIAAEAGLPDEFNDVDSDDFKKILRYTVMHADAEFHPLQAFYGGVCAQEVMKFTGKFMPLNQWLYLDCFEILDEELPADRAPQGTRYDHMISMFGAAFAQKVHEARTYLVGCGALGCEFAKNFAMIGFATSGDGHLYITDPDNIEVSNLARQFLFRKSHAEAKANKASTARGAINKMNPDVQVTTYEKFAAPSTEDLFDDTFYQSMTFVTNALDNVQARNYVDGRIVAACKPLLESGTQGTKCNSLVFLPHKTGSYTDGAQISDEDGDAIPMCTLRNFPNLINHCVEWARAMFTDMFEAPFHVAAEYAADKDTWLKRVADEAAGSPAAKKMKVKELRALLEMVEFAAKGPTFENCVEFAREQMFRMHRDNILDLTENFPADAVKDGKPFWSKRRRFPQAANYDPSDPLQSRYLKCVANIYAVNFGLQPSPDSTQPETLVAPGHAWRQDETVAAALQGQAVRPWVFSGEKAAADDDEAAEAAKADAEGAGGKSGDGEQEEDYSAAFDDLMKQLANADTSALTFVEADFEKDLDANFHIDYIWSATNLRAWNYQLELASRHKTKMIAGKIIPAILTATAAICGMITVEIIKIIKGVDDLDSYRVTSNNLGTNEYMISIPSEVKKNDSQKDAEDTLKSAERNMKQTMERYQKQVDEGKELSPGNLQTIANCQSRLESSQAGLKSAQPCYPAGWTKWDTIEVEAESLSWGKLISMLEEQSGFTVQSLHPVSNVCTFFNASEFVGQQHRCP